MEYSLPEATIGAKWECVWNGNIFSNFQLFTEFRRKLLIKILYIYSLPTLHN